MFEMVTVMKIRRMNNNVLEICDQDSKVILSIAEELVEVLQANPGAVPNTQTGRVILESDLNTVQRNIAEQDQVCQRKNDHQMQGPVLLELDPKLLQRSLCQSIGSHCTSGIAHLIQSFLIY